MTTYTVF